MSIGIKFWEGCWIYPKKTESNNMKAIIKLLKKEKSFNVENILFQVRQETKACRDSISSSLKFLLVLKVVKIEQHKKVRVYSLMKGWNFRLNKAIIDYSGKKTAENKKEEVLSLK